MKHLPLLLLGLPFAASVKTSYSFPPFAGSGVCSDTMVDTFSYTVVSAPISLNAVLVCNKQTFDALLPANLSDPTTARLPPVLYEMSCVNKNDTKCSFTFPKNRRLAPQIMCILLKNWNKQMVNATLEVEWGRRDFNTSNSTRANETTIEKALDAEKSSGSKATLEWAKMAMAGAIIMKVFA